MFIAKTLFLSFFIAKNQNKSGNNQKQRPNEIGKMLRPANNICQAKQNANSNQNESDIFVFVRKQKNCTNDKWIVFKIKNNIGNKRGQKFQLTKKENEAKNE